MVGPHAQHVVGFPAPGSGALSIFGSPWHRGSPCSPPGTACATTPGLRWTCHPPSTGPAPGGGPGPRRCRRRGTSPPPRSWGPRTLWPSMGATWPSVRAKVFCTQSRKPSSNRAARSRAKSRPSVSCEGILCGSARKVRSHSSLSWPKSAMTASTGSTRMSVRWCRLVRSTRGYLPGSPGSRPGTKASGRP